MTEPDTVNSPDALKSDPESMAFYVLRDETLAICKTRQELPYWKNRSTYLSSGRYSSKYKKVVFWPDPVNPAKAMHLLKEHQHIESDYTYAVAGSAVRKPKSKPKSGVEKLDGVRKRSVEVLLANGMRQQKSETDKDDSGD
jgi:hypothetical protein